MSPSGLRVIGFVFLIGAVVFAVLNLKRVAGLGMPWIAPLLIVLGALFVGLSKRAQR